MKNSIGCWNIALGFVAAAMVVLPVRAAPVISSVAASQRAGTALVDISYDVASPSAALCVTVQVSTNNGVTYDLAATNFSGAGYGTNVVPGAGRQVVWNAGSDWLNNYSTSVWFRITAIDEGTPDGMALIPAGSFTMGDTFGEGYESEVPTHSVYISSFYMSINETTRVLWDTVYAWATNNGYSFSHSGDSKGTNHPVVMVSWHDAVKWCNARSEMDGLTPCYYTNASLTGIHRTGEPIIYTNYVNWTASGYRLPTEAEWEKAARGGSAGRRFAWGDADNITHDRANYFSTASNAYDISASRGYHPVYDTHDSQYPYTAPAGTFAANGYGLRDMVGNAFELCWDWYQLDYYSAGTGATNSDTRGPNLGNIGPRVSRGGSWSDGSIVDRWDAYECRVSYRYSTPATGVGTEFGFRCARSSGGATGSGAGGPVTVDTRGILPPAPSGFSASKGLYEERNLLGWQPAETASGYVLYRAQSDNSSAAVAIGTASGTNYSDTGAVPGALYYYWVRATNACGAGSLSASDSGWRLDISSGVCADYDGDRKADPAVYDEVGEIWKIKLSGSGYGQVNTAWSGLGGRARASVAADYDGDAKADPAAYVEEHGQWVIMPSSAGYTVAVALAQALGGAGYTGMPGDYDGDAKADPCVYERASGNWQVMLSTASYAIVPITGLLGGAGFRAVAADYDGDRKADPAVYAESSGYWIVKLSSIGYVQIALSQPLGGEGYIPVPADYDGDLKADPAVKSATGNQWQVMFSGAGYATVPLTLVFE